MQAPHATAESLLYTMMAVRPELVSPGPAVGSKAFEAILDRDTGSVRTFGNRVKLLTSGAKTLQAQCQAIEEAHKSVLLQTFILRPDRVGEKVIDAMRRASERGVKVAAALDAIGSYRTPMWRKAPWWNPLGWGARLNALRGKRFVQKQIRQRCKDIKVYASNPNRLWGVNHRWHQKITAIDQTKAFVVTSNVGYEYDTEVGVQQGKAPNGKYFRYDIGLELQGPAAQVLHDIVESNIKHCETGSLPETPKAQLPAGSDRPETGGHPIRVVSQLPGGGEVANLNRLCIRSARRSIRIVTPYLSLPPHMMELIAAKRRQGVAIEIITCSPRSVESQTLYDAYRKKLKTLLEIGVDVYNHELQMPHAKTVEIDGKLTLVQSANQNPRSYHRDAEVAVVLYHHDDVRNVNREFEDLKKRSQLLSDLPPQSWYRWLRGSFWDALAGSSS